jgi:hypothetical protein
MATLLSCPKSDCPPTEVAPVHVPESGEGAGAESERAFTTDEVAALLNVPLDRNSTAGRGRPAASVRGVDARSHDPATVRPHRRVVGVHRA